MIIRMYVSFDISSSDNVWFQPALFWLQFFSALVAGEIENKVRDSNVRYARQFYRPTL